MDFDWNWRLKPYDRQKAYELTQKLGILPVTARLLTQRGIKNAPEAYQYLYGGLKDLEDPLVLGGMDRAVARINRCIDAREKVMVYGDYDVDGICSMVLLLQALKKLGCQADYYVPDRFSEGYGLNLPAVEEIAQKGYQLLITVDCGISSCEEVETANRLGMDVIITDHHSPSQVLPEAFAVINPKLKARESTKDLAGVGVVFKLVQSLMESRAMAEDVYEWLDLVALATIADVVPLLGENRIFVKYGLKQMAHTNSLGLKALIKKAGLEGRPLTPWHIGFILAPRLNSAGRLENADLAVELLLTQDYAQAEELAGSLCQLNQERKSIEDKVFQEAVQQVTGGKEKELPPVLVLAQEAWHPGVLGIVASKIADKYQRPAILISWDGEEGRGSCRSIEGFDIYEALYNCREYLVKFGGHKLAAGLTIKRNSFEDFINAMCLQGQDHLAVGAGKEQMADLLLDLDEISYRLMDELKMLEPFGEGNPTPRFITKSAEVREPLLVGKNQEHFKCHIGGIFPGIAFFSGPHLLNSPYNESLHDLVYKLEKKEFNNANLDLHYYGFVFVNLNLGIISLLLAFSASLACPEPSGKTA
jgi:single-stranded-DNA-specific exonuclease